MAWSNDKTVGNFNSKLIVEVVLNSQSGNSSNITVRIRLRNGGNSTAFDNNGTSWSMSNGVSASGSDTFSIGAGSTGTLASRSFTVAHNANGTKSLTVTVNVGNTSTTTFGTPGSLSVSFTLPRLASAPSKPARPSINNVTRSSLRGNLSSAPANNGASIIEYGWQLQGATSDSGTTSGRSWDVAGLTSNSSYQVRVRARNSVGWGAWSEWSASVTTSPEVPLAPSSVSVSRWNNLRQDVSWTRNATSARPYAEQRVQRRQMIAGSWSPFATIAKVSGTATSFSDTTTSANNNYQYRIQAWNPQGAALSGNSPAIRTTPDAPTDVVAKKEGDNIVVSYVRSTPYASDTLYTIQDNPGGSGWVTVGTTTNTSSFTHNSPDPTRTHQYRVQVTDTNSSPNLSSSWSDVSNIVQLLAAPNPPTLVAPTGTLNRDADVTFRWTHNPVDTTDQTNYELRYRVNGGTWTTLTGTTASERTVNALGVSGSVEWQARTRGESSSWSPWAAVKTFTLASQPTVAINAPEGPVLDVSTVELVWEYDNADVSGQSQWQAELLDDSEAIVEQRSGAGSGSSTVFRAALVDGETYTARVRARSGAGVWSEWDTSTFVTDFPLPAPVEALPEWDRATGAVSLSFDAQPWAQHAWEGTPDASPSTRVDGDGTVTNIFPNPDMVATAGNAVVWENLVTNGSFEDGTTGWVATRTSTFASTATHKSKMWAEEYGGPGVGLGDRLLQLTAAESSGSPGDFYAITPSSHWMAVTPGDWLAVRALSAMDSAVEARLVVQYFVGDKSTQVEQVPASYEHLDFYEGGILESVSEVPEGAAYFCIALWCRRRDEGALQGDERAWFDDVVAVTGATEAEARAKIALPAFDETHSPDPDLWAEPRPGGGAQLVGKRVAGVSNSAGGVVIQSAQWSRSGEYSLRIIKTNNEAAMGYIPSSAIPSEVKGGAVWRYQPKELTPNSPWFGRVGWDGARTEPATQTEELMRVERDGASGHFYLTGHFAEAGESVWYDLLTLVDVENYAGPPFSGNMASTVATEWIDVQRDDGDGWVTIAVDLDPETSIVDYTPRLGEVRYRAISRTSLPSAQVGDVAVTEWAHGGRDPVFVNGGPDFEVVRAAIGHEVSDSPSIEQSAHEWAGWEKPTAVFGEGQSYAVQFQANLFPHIPNLDGRSTREEWHELLLEKNIVCYRDCEGRKIFGLLGINFQTASSVTRLALTVEETHFDEGVPDSLPVPEEGSD